MLNKNKVIIGLGNPGEKYLKTRHNAGFIMIDEIQRELSFPEFKLENKFNAYISEKIVEARTNTAFFKKIFQKKNPEKIFLIKPLSFMNKSGEVIRKFIDFYKIPTENIIVIHDDLDLSVGTYKISENSGSGGHNGIQNIIQMIGTQRFKRIKVGIERKEGRNSRKISGENFVLQNFSEEELKVVKSISKDIRNVII